MYGKKTALVIGANGMDGSFLCELLLEKGYDVHGTIRRSSVITTWRIDHIFEKISLHYIDITDAMSVNNLIVKLRPDEIYNTAAQSHVQISAELENYTLQVNTIGVLNILQSVRNNKLGKTCKIYQCGTSEQFGNETDGSLLLNEKSPQNPVSVYGVSKNAAQNLCNFYRDAYGMFVVCGILMNHEGPRRGHNFVTQKISNYVGKFKNGKVSKPLELGNLNAKRDWGNSRDYVYGMWLMLQQNEADNYLLATGETHTVREFAELSFKHIGITIEWHGDGVNEVGKNTNGDVLVVVNSKYYRDLELHTLIGNASKARKILGWAPITTFKQLVGEMVDASIERFS